MKIEINEQELKLIQEVLINESVSYMAKGTVKENIDIFGQEWSENLLKKSDDMIGLINKLHLQVK